MDTNSLALLPDSMNENKSIEVKWLLDFWLNLPELVRHLLLIGATGRHHLTHIATESLKLCRQEQQTEKMRSLLSLCSQLLMAAWEEDPLNVETASQLWEFHCAIPFLDKHLASLIRAVCEQGEALKDSSDGKSSLSEPNNVEAQLKRQSALTPLECRTVYWDAVSRGSYEDAIRLLEGSLSPRPLDSLREVYLASLYWLSGNYDRFIEVLSLRRRALSDADYFFWLGNLAFVKGERHKALKLWFKCLSVRPWLTHLILRVYDVANELDRIRSPLKGRIAICLYTYNKAKELEKSLESLAKSNLTMAKIVLLVNGCTDATLEVARSWQDKFGAERFRIINLPVNIGAPAARNWLMHDPKVLDSDWVVYLDDDAIVPPNWLNMLGSAVERYPKAGVWGCKVIDAKVPSTVQSVDYHILPPFYGEDTQNAVPFRLSALHYQNIDQGQFDYLRPCIHVTGCCHLFSTKVLLESGDFDLRFSPSQYDDLDHDFRLAFIGKPAVYQGHLSVKHMNQTGKESRIHMKKMTSTYANLYKLYHKYSPEEYQKLVRYNMRLIEDDFFQKLEEISTYGQL